MHSTDLPVTEWWDPEWDVYSVPLSPFEDRGSVPLEDHVETWWAAYEHQWLLGWIMSGEAAYIPSKFQHQLTTGGEVTPTQCTCYYAGSTWHDGPMVREYHLEQNPDCPLHWAPSWLAPCMCRYGLRHVDGIPGTHPLDPFRHAWKRGVYAFRIHPGCPHHGENLREHPWREMEADEAAYWTVLDDNERRGH